jgi:hypothetical protein
MRYQLAPCGVLRPPQAAESRTASHWPVLSRSTGAFTEKVRTHRRALHLSSDFDGVVTPPDLGVELADTQTLLMAKRTGGVKETESSPSVLWILTSNYHSNLINAGRARVAVVLCRKSP